MKISKENYGDWKTWKRKNWKTNEKQDAENKDWKDENEITYKAPERMDVVLLLLTFITMQMALKLKPIFKENNVKWHKNCTNKLNNLKLHGVVKKSESKVKNESDTGSSTSKNTRNAKLKSGQIVCIFCDQSGKTPLHMVQTLVLDNKVRSYRKISTGDLIALELEYHLNCLHGFYGRVEKFRKQKGDFSTSTSVEGIDLLPT
ncbi:hypothetical protein FQA39_LY15129 [Lamprigera yunnana]|nr:hypothetical protein FQA39_LY15129 [Lamprigera yunnana]